MSSELWHLKVKGNGLIFRGGNSFKIVLLLYEMRSTLKGKNLLQREQILSFQSKPLFQKGLGGKGSHKSRLPCKMPTSLITGFFIVRVSLVGNNILSLLFFKRSLYFESILEGLFFGFFSHFFLGVRKTDSVLATPILTA